MLRPFQKHILGLHTLNDVRPVGALIELKDVRMDQNRRTPMLVALYLN
jgi:hypothetical protein